MNTNDLILEHLKKKIHDLTYYEHISCWSNVNYDKKIERLIIEVKSICDVMNIIGHQKFWVHVDGIHGYGNKFCDVRKRFGLFKDVK